MYISQDGNHTGVQQLVQHFGQHQLAPPVTKAFTHWQRERVPHLGPKQVRSAEVDLVLLSKWHAQLGHAHCAGAPACAAEHKRTLTV